MFIHDSFIYMCHFLDIVDSFHILDSFIFPHDSFIYICHFYNTIDFCNDSFRCTSHFAMIHPNAWVIFAMIHPNAYVIFAYNLFVCMSFVILTMIHWNVCIIFAWWIIFFFFLPTIHLDASATFAHDSFIFKSILPTVVTNLLEKMMYLVTKCWHWRLSKKCHHVNEFKASIMAVISNNSKIFHE